MGFPAGLFIVVWPLKLLLLIMMCYIQGCGVLYWNVYVNNCLFFISREKVTVGFVSV